MSALLNGLKFTNAKRPTQITGVQIRRNKLSNRLFEQIKLATALRDGSNYTPTHLRSVRDKYTGELKRIEQIKRIRQWWFTSDAGKVCIQIKYGSRVLDIGGKDRKSTRLNSSHT